MHIWLTDDCEMKALHAALATLQTTLNEMGARHIMAFADITAAIGAIGAGLDDLAGDIQTLTNDLAAQAANGLTPDQASGIQAQLQALAVRAGALAAQTPNMPPVNPT